MPETIGPSQPFLVVMDRGIVSIAAFIRRNRYWSANGGAWTHYFVYG